MRVAGVHVENFRAVNSLSVSLGPSTSLLGENNAGKSSLLSAINLFFDSSPSISISDCHNNNSDNPVRVSLEFVDLTPEEREQFAGNLIDDKLTVVREFYTNDSVANGRFFVEAMVFPPFSDCRAESGANPKRDLYRSLQELYPELPNVTRADQIEPHLEAWEQDHQDLLERKAVAGFRGFKNVAAGQLRKKTELIYVPAVSEAIELAKGKASPVKKLLNTIARQTIENSEKFKSFKAQADAELKELTSPDSVPQLASISENLTDILSRYYANSQLKATWEPVTELPISYPESSLSVIDHKFESPIDNVGHGLQRAILFSILEFMAQSSSDGEENQSADADEFTEAQSDIILLVEEPEIYQHPLKQRLFREAFQALAADFDAQSGIRMQVIYTTHSPLMVDIKAFENIRVFRRVLETTPPSVQVMQATLEECAHATAEFVGKEPDFSLYRRGLHIFTPEIAEGFFAKKVVLVEGEGDRAILEAYYTQGGRSPVAEGIHIATAIGKTNFDKPISIFSRVGVPVFSIFDNDISDKKHAAKHKQYNKLLQRLCGCEEAVDYPEGCDEKFAAFRSNLEKHVRDAVNNDDYFDKVREQIAEINSMKVEDTLKSPTVASQLFGIFLKNGIEFPLLGEIVAAVDKL